MKHLFTSESVSEGHPDKIADQISDAILDNILAHDPDAKVACETLVTTNRVILSGEINSTYKPDVDTIVREVIARIGYTKPEYGFSDKTVEITNLLHEQSPDINQAVVKGDNEIGAGDQGMMFGYATNETPNYMPLPIYLSHMLMRTLADLRKSGHVMKYLRPDAKSQVTVEYDGRTPVHVDTIVISTQHDDVFADDKEMVNVITNDIKKYLIPIVQSALPEHLSDMIDDKTKYIINPSGRFVIGGAAGDTGLTGRKIIVDTYGGKASHGGGAFCVDGYTEYLSRNGWKKISEYDGEEVAQWDNGVMSFVKPLVYHVHDAEKMYRFSNAKTLDMVLSENHNVVLETSKGNSIKKRVKDLIDDNCHIRNGNNGFIPCSFKYENTSDGINLTDDEIRLQVAFCADGTLATSTPQIKIKKEYKINALEKLLTETVTGYAKHYENGDERTIYVFNPPIHSKSLRECFSNANSKQMAIIAEELVKWDGNNDNCYRTTIKENADYAQFVFMVATGCSSSITVDDRIGQDYHNKNSNKSYTRKSICYKVYKLKRRNTSFRNSKDNNAKINVEPFTPSDGKMYCFTVPSTMLVLRRNNRVFITGNSGKDSSKVDRSFAYVTRHIAKNLVAAGIADEVLIQISTAIGLVNPVSICVNTFGTSHLKVDNADELIADFIKEMEITPLQVINYFGLKKPIYSETAAYGHFGRLDTIKSVCFNETSIIKVSLFPWERLELVAMIIDHFKKYM